MSDKESNDSDIEKLRSLDKYVKAMRQEIGDRLDKIAGQVSELREDAEEVVVERPLTATSVAFILGLLLGAALAVNMTSPKREK